MRLVRERTPDAGRSQIRPINSRKTMRPFLRKQMTKVKHKTKKQITKFLTHTTGDSRRQQKGISLGMLKDLSLPTMDNKQQRARNQHKAFCVEELTPWVGVNYSTSYEPFTCLTRSRVAGRWWWSCWQRFAVAVLGLSQEVVSTPARGRTRRSPRKVSREGGSRRAMLWSLDSSRIHSPNAFISTYLWLEMIKISVNESPNQYQRCCYEYPTRNKEGAINGRRTLAND